MRTSFSALFLALAAAIASPAQPVPELTLEASPDREFYRADATNKIYLAVRLGSKLPATSTPAPSAETTPPAEQPHGNFAFVLDRSGSMSGEPVEALRAALANAIRSLRDDDLVSIVVFGSEVETLLPATPRAQLTDLDALLAKIEPAGGAALYDALNQGAAQLRRLAGPASANHLILLTDGPATKGPRELEDFTKLAEAFARENITLSAIGLGPDFNEDQLAALARTGHGDFHYAAQPAALATAFTADLAPRHTLLAREAVLTVRFQSDCEDLATYGWPLAELATTTATYRFPALFAEQDLNLLVSAVLSGRRFSANLASLRLQWQDPRTGEARELTRSFEVFFENDSEAVRKSQIPAAVRISARALISEGLQKAIEQLDKGDPRRALRTLRSTRSDALSLNYELDDPVITAQIKTLEAYLAEVEPRGLSALDRKTLRSGLAGRFDPPTAEEEPAVTTGARVRAKKSP